MNKKYTEVMEEAATLSEVASIAYTCTFIMPTHLERCMAQSGDLMLRRLYSISVCRDYPARIAQGLPV